MSLVLPIPDSPCRLAVTLPLADQCIGFLGLLSKLFIPVPYRAHPRPPHRTQHIFKFIFQTATTAPPVTGTRPTQRNLGPAHLVSAFASFFVVLLEHGDPLNLTYTIRGIAQDRGRLDVRSRRILVKRGERLSPAFSVQSTGASRFGGPGNAIAMLYLSAAFPSDAASEAWSLLTRF